MINTIDSRSETNQMAFYDLSLRDKPGPKRTFEGPSNTSNTLPRHYGKITLNLDPTPVGVERFFPSRRTQCYLGGSALYATGFVEGLGSLSLSAIQIAEAWKLGSTTSSTGEFVLTQAISIAGVVVAGALGDFIIKQAPRTRTRQ